MKFNSLLILLFIFCASLLHAENRHAMDSLPYYNIPAHPDSYDAGNMLVRLIDGLGYRYYWASHALTDETLAYKASEDSRTILETTEHIHALSETIKNAAHGLPNIRSKEEKKTYTFEAYRKMTLENLFAARTVLLNKTAEEIAEVKIIFQRADRTSEFPVWNLINGPITDAIYHVGQIIAFRRAAGQPVDSRMNVFSGKTRD